MGAPGLLAVGLASLAGQLLLGLLDLLCLLAGGLLGLAGLLVYEVAGRAGLLADQPAHGLGLLADGAGQRSRCLGPTESEVPADVYRPLHELEVALDYRDQVDLRQARKHVIAQAPRALGPEVGDLLGRAGRLARRSAVALGGAGHMYALLRSNRIQYFRIRYANYIKQCVLCQAFLVEHDEQGWRPSLMLVSRQRIPPKPAHTAPDIRNGRVRGRACGRMRGWPGIGS